MTAYGRKTYDYQNYYTPWSDDPTFWGTILQPRGKSGTSDSPFYLWKEITVQNKTHQSAIIDKCFTWRSIMPRYGWNTA